MAPLAALETGMETCPLPPSVLAVISKVSGAYERSYVVVVICVELLDIFNGTLPNIEIACDEFRLIM